MPNDNIKRVLEKAGGAGSGDNYEIHHLRGLRPRRRGRDCGDHDR